MGGRLPLRQWRGLFLTKHQLRVYMIAGADWRTRRNWEAEHADSSQRAFSAKRVGAVIVGTGVDIAETARLGEALDRHGERFASRIYTPQEIAYCERFKNKAERYAARFAAKEAAFKALGTGWREGVRWLDVEVTHQPSGKPELVLSGRAKELAEEMGVARTEVSISHANHYVVAVVIFEANG